MDSITQTLEDLGAQVEATDTFLHASFGGRNLAVDTYVDDETGQVLASMHAGTGERVGPGDDHRVVPAHRAEAVAVEMIGCAR